jgi:hypothetical protein
VDTASVSLKKVHCGVRGHNCAAQLRAKRKGNAGGDKRHGRTEGHELSSLVAKLRHCTAVLSLEWHVARWCNGGSRVGEGTREETVSERVATTTGVELTPKSVLVPRRDAKGKRPSLGS